MSETMDPIPWGLHESALQLPVSSTEAAMDLIGRDWAVPASERLYRLANNVLKTTLEGERDEQL
jgi:hypothetical protein